MMLRLTAISAVCLSLAGQGAAAEPAEKVVLGYISAGKVFAFSRMLHPDGPQEHGDVVVHQNTYYLAQRPLVPLRGVKRHGRVDEIHDFGDGDVPLRWCVRRGCVFESSVGHPRAGHLQIRLKWLDKWWETQDKDVRTADDSGLMLMNYMFWKAGDDSAYWTADPVKELLRDIFEAERDREKGPREPRYSLSDYTRFANLRVGYDLLPSGQLTARLFWLHDGTMREAAGSLQRIKKDEHETTWAKPARYRVPFAGHFHVFARGQDLYFVTNDGDVYHASAAARDKSRTVTKIDALGCRAGLILHDDASGKTFAFALPRPTKAGVTSGAFAELAPGAKRKSFAPLAVSPLSRKLPLQTVWDCARLLLADKLIAEK